MLRLLLVLGFICNFGCPFLLDTTATTTGLCHASIPCSCSIETNSTFNYLPYKIPNSSPITKAKLQCANHALTNLSGQFVLHNNVSQSGVTVEFHFEKNLIQMLPTDVLGHINFGTGHSTLDNDFLVFYFSENLISTIQRGAFDFVNDFYLDLSNNRLKTIQHGAFTGTGGMFIDLRNNGLSGVPLALTETQILGLRLEGNPIKSFDGSIFHSINANSSLLYVSLGLDNLSHWPHELHLLNNVQRLGLYGIPFYILSTDAFHDHEHTLQNLTIVDSKLSRVPSSISNLKLLQALVLKNNDNFDDTLFDFWTTSMPAVSSLEISGSPGISFPHVFLYFPNISELVLSGNKMEFIDTTKIMTDSINSSCQLYRVTLDNNEFFRIPTALNALAQCLKVLSIQSNKITTIEMFDIRYYRYLTELYLQGNPIKYIAPYLYGSNLRTFRLDNTDLSTIPVCVQNLNNMTNFGISGQPIECSCSNLAHLKAWDISTLGIFDGFCEYSTTSLQSYIEHDLRSCPDDSSVVKYPDFRPFYMQISFVG